MPQELSRNERIKEASRYLRGTLAEGLAEEITGGIIENDQQLVKSHGMYLQDDRDLRGERRRKKTIQLHGIIKANLKATMARIDFAMWEIYSTA
jgi:sulfite reductase beta subunit-like hemoprotein